MPVRFRTKLGPRRILKCYWILCYLPPLDWQKRTEIFQVDPAKLSPEVIVTIEQVIGKMPSLGAIKKATRNR